METMITSSLSSLGYQTSQNQFDNEPNINNAGNPFANESFYNLNYHKEERELVNWFCENVLCISPKKYWGYCSSGSTESIMCGLWMARKRFSSTRHNSNITIYASKECHFCVPKIADILNISFVDVPVHEDTNEMNMNALYSLLVHNNEKEKMNDGQQHGAIVVLTMGTTIRNGYDDIERFNEEIIKKMGSSNTNIHVHLDAALGGVIYPFIKPEWLHYPFDSFNVSFHKYLGCPNPCSLFLTRKQIQKEINGKGCYGKDMICLPEKDFTIACSRNGTVIKRVRDHVLQDNFIDNHVKSIKKCLFLRDYFLKCVSNNNKQIKIKVSNESLSLSIEIFQLPCSYMYIFEKYGLSIRKKNATCFDTHIYIQKHVEKTLLDDFISDLMTVVTTAEDYSSNGCFIA